MTATSNVKTATQDFKEHEKSRKHATTKRTHCFIVTDSNNTKICDLPDKEFKIAVWTKLNELQENIERQFNEIWKTIHEQNEKFSKEIKTIKKKQTNSGVEEYNEWNF